MKLQRLWQPRRGVWWLMLAFNAFSSAFAWAMRALPLSTTGTLLIGSLGLINALCGLWIASRLLNGE